MTEQDVLDVLAQARGLLADPERWTKGAEARDVDGNDLITYIHITDGEVLEIVRSERAASWCVGGALNRFAGETIEWHDPRFEALWRQVDDCSLVQWNDRVTHEEMLRALDDAIMAQRRVLETGGRT
jgi:hypothetical protein